MDKNYYADGYEAGYQAGKEEKKPWVGLTDDERVRITDFAKDDIDAMVIAEAALKEKNNG